MDEPNKMLKDRISFDQWIEGKVKLSSIGQAYPGDLAKGDRECYTQDEDEKILLPGMPRSSIEHQAVTKGLTSSSKFSGSCVLTLQTSP